MLDFLQEMQQSFVNYAMAVNTDRSIPDATSGLKPVHRRILYTCFDKKYLSSKKYVKCAKITGDVMGIFHPHGDTAIYEALVRLSQDWIMRYPLIDFHGNQGAITGDGPASMRYTEARLAPIAEEGMLQKVKTTVDFIPNYDETTIEPVTLPALFPNLLCNPTTGIGVAMASNWAPHNLREVAAAINAVIEGKDPYNYILGPDFPTGGIVINKDDIPQILKTGRGSVKIRADYKIEKNQIIFTEIPYGTTLEAIIDDIGKNVDKGNIPHVTDVHDETDINGIRIVITFIPESNIDLIIKSIYHYTKLQSSFSYNQRALVNGEPQLLSIKDAIEYYLNFNQNCLLKEAIADKEKTEKRLNIVVGLLKALDIIDEIITFIKNSTSSSIAKQGLITNFKFNEEQAQAILDMKLSHLAKLEGDKLRQEKSDLEKLLIWLQDLIDNKNSRLKELQKRLTAFVNKYGDERRTKLIQDNVALTAPEKEKPIAEETLIIFENNKIRRTSINNALKKKTGLKTDTLKVFDIFTSSGKLYKLPVKDIPESKGGVLLTSLINIPTHEKVLYITQDYTSEYLVFCTRNGLIKKVPTSEFKNLQRTGIASTKLKDNDELISVFPFDSGNIYLISQNGYKITFDGSTLTSVSRLTYGVKGIKLDENDYVVIASPMTKNIVILELADKNEVEVDISQVTTKAGKGCRIKDLSSKVVKEVI